MAERPLGKQNWHQRSIQTFGPKFRLDLNNPTMGVSGTDVYNFYAVTDNKDVCITGLSEGGVYKIYNDQSIEIVAGQKSKSTGVDIMICGKNGDVCITAEKNGTVRIRASEIVIDADENISLNAGKDLNIKVGGRLLIQGQQADCDVLTGNLAPKGSSFGEIAFAGTFVDADLISSTFSGGQLTLF
jgi:hypothetical protein